MTRPHSLPRLARRGRTRTLMAALVALFSVLVVPTASANTPAIPSCLNYISPTQAHYGDVLVRKPNATALQFDWRIYDPTERAGLYQWRVYINDQPAAAGGYNGLEIKDDGLHAVLQRVVNGRVMWNPGDTFHLDATHLSEAQNQTYITPYNYCRIP